MDMVGKRKLKEMIRGIIGDGFKGTQLDLVKALKTKGIRVTQSTVSRTMAQMGVIKDIHERKTIYRLKQTNKNFYRGSLADLILEITHNETLIVVKTLPGSAMFVAGFLDHECKAILLGTIAGDDTIFAAPKSSARIKNVYAEIVKVLKC